MPRSELHSIVSDVHRHQHFDWASSIRNSFYVSFRWHFAFSEIRLIKCIFTDPWSIWSFQCCLLMRYEWTEKTSAECDFLLRPHTSWAHQSLCRVSYERNFARSWVTRKQRAKTSRHMEWSSPWLWQQSQAHVINLARQTLARAVCCVRFLVEQNGNHAQFASLVLVRLCLIFSHRDIRWKQYSIWRRFIWKSFKWKVSARSNTFYR